MSRNRKKEAKKHHKISRSGVPVLESDKDFLSVFDKEGRSAEITDTELQGKKVSKNKHGVPVLKEKGQNNPKDFADENEDFEALLDEYYRQQKGTPFKKPDPMPLKKRLKRYPPVETELDLHGLRAVEAQLRVRSFIQTCKFQGFFTIRIIVGKGLHSELGPVLPDVVEDVVREMTSEGTVIWHSWDRKKKTKSGSLIVYLKQFDRFD